MATGASTSAPTPVELGLYHVGEKGIIELGVLELEGLLPAAEATLQRGAGTDASLQGATLGVGLYISLSEGGEILDLAYLSPLVEMAKGEECSGEEEADDSTTEEEVAEEEEEEVLETSEEDEVVWESSEEEVESSEEEEVVVWESSEEEVESSEEEEEVVESSEEEVVGKSSEDDTSTLYSQIRIWPDSRHATIALFDGGCWKLTKAYSINWLRSNEEQLMLKLIHKEKNQQIMACWLKGCLSKLEFTGPLSYSKNLEEIIEKEMNPTMDYFIVNKPLGKGATSKVYQCSLKKSPMTSYAVKIIKATSTYDIDAYNGKEPREIQIMSCFNDPSIVTFYQAWSATESYLDEKGACLDDGKGSYSDGGGSSESDDSHFDVYLHIHMEICCRTLRDVLALGEYRVDLQEGWILFENIAEALNSIHQKGVIHRDIKPENIFIGYNGKIKLGDFGDSLWENSHVDGRDGTPGRGTELYMAPELEDGKVSKKVDVYSLGVIFLEIFHPFKTGQGRYHALNDIKESKYPIDWIGDTDILKKLIARSPIERPSIKDILDYIRRQ